MALRKKRSGKKGGRPRVVSIAKKAKGGKRGRRPSVRTAKRGRYSKR